jgi:hypothetical protein
MTAIFSKPSSIESPPPSKSNNSIINWVATPGTGLVMAEIGNCPPVSCVIQLAQSKSYIVGAAYGIIKHIVVTTALRVVIAAS